MYNRVSVIISRRLLTRSSIKNDKCSHYSTDSKIRTSLGGERSLADGRKLRFELADNDDLELVVREITNGFIKHNNLFRCLNAPYADAEPLLRGFIEPVLSHGGTVFAKCDGVIAGTRVMSIVPRDKISQRFGSISKLGIAPKIAFPTDYGTSVAKAPHKNENAKIVHAFILSLYTQLGQFLPSDIKQLGFGEMLRVNENFMNLGIATALYEVSEQLAREKGCDIMANVTTTRASTNIFKRRDNFSAKYCFPYNKFVVNGKRPFLHPYDKNYGATINVGIL